MIKVVMKVFCSGGESFENCDAECTVDGSIEADIESGGWVELQLLPDLPPGWSFGLGRYPCCPDHGRKA